VPLRFIRPCSPIRATTPPVGEAWLHEPKLDGYRLQIIKSGPTVRLYSRNGHEWTARLATVTDALQGLACRSAVIDAELCFLTGTGAPNFAGLQLALRSRQHHKLTVFAFDFLHRNGIDLRPLPLYQRKLRLLRLIARSDIPCLHLVETFDDGAKLLDSAERMLLEGIVSKRRNSVYRSGECRDWVKIKTESWRAANRERWRLFERGRM
jgi:bifunctional non-homologous end joining protein LigD